VHCRLSKTVTAASAVLALIGAGAHAAHADDAPPAASTAPGAVGPGPTAAFIDEAYLRFLGRHAGADDIDRWSVEVHRDRRSAFTRALATSPEAVGADIDELYRTVLGREADPDGRSHWIRVVVGGARLEDVADGVYGSTEHFRRIGSTHHRYVDSLYEGILGRTPDDAGAREWTALLDGGRTDRAGVARAFHASLESRRSRVRDTYLDVLGREPDAGGLEHWSERLTALGALDLAALLAASPEFHVRATGLAPADVRVVPVGPGTAHPLTSSWHPGCPVHHDELVAVEFPHVTPAGSMTRGVLVVHRHVAGAVSEVVRTLHGTAFPLTSARPVDDFGGDDDRSMAADNSSAFNCRTVAGTTTWSQHAHGTAVDLNPVRNPYVRGETVEPPAGVDWTDRNDIRPGMVVEGGPVVAAFDRLGWGWGGRWTSAKDHQHFSTNGR
jgi:hypothetical protein